MYLIELTYGHSVQTHKIVPVMLRSTLLLSEHHTYYCQKYSCSTVFQRNYLHTPTQDIELRFCQDQHRDEDGEGILITDMELYVY